MSTLEIAEEIYGVLIDAGVKEESCTFDDLMALCYGIATGKWPDGLDASMEHLGGRSLYEMATDWIFAFRAAGIEKRPSEVIHAALTAARK